MKNQENISDDKVIDQLQTACTRVTDSVAMLHATVLRNQQVESVVGTSYCVDERGFFVTALHVVAEQINSFISMGSIYETRVVAVDVENDLALVKVVQAHPRFTPVHFANKIKAGAIVGGLGFPDHGLAVELDSFLARYAGPVVNGIGPHGLVLQGDILKSALSFVGGNASEGYSGGPIVDVEGNVVASTMKADNDIGFIIGPPAAVILPFVQQHVRAA